jgi:hypothetical protein
MEDKKEFQESLKLKLSEKLIDSEKKYLNYMCGFAHNINSPLTGVISRIDIVEIKLNKLESAFHDNNPFMCLRFLNEIKEEVAKMINASEGVNSLIESIQNFAAEMALDEPVSINFKDKFEELILFLNCNLHIKHNLKIVVVDKLAKKMKFKKTEYYIKPVQLVLEVLADYLPETTKEHEITITLSNDENQKMLHIKIELSVAKQTNIENIQAEAFECAEICTIKRNGSFSVDNPQHIKAITVSLPL